MRVPWENMVLIVITQIMTNKPLTTTRLMVVGMVVMRRQMTPVLARMTSTEIARTTHEEINRVGIRAAVVGINRNHMSANKASFGWPCF
jgi:hypothetical protein